VHSPYLSTCNCFVIHGLLGNSSWQHTDLSLVAEKHNQQNGGAHVGRVGVFFFNRSAQERGARVMHIFASVAYM
jgi:hypothetical protein